MAGHVLVVALAEDRAAAAGIRTVREQLIAPDDHLHGVSIESLVEVAGERPSLAAWASSFRQRYLDLSPVE